jgi:4-carboxymuconolactone decarboxylase
LMILRIAVRAGAAYEWDQHVRIARRAGLTDDEILRGATGQWEGLAEVDQALLEATDSLLDRRGVDDDLWLRLRKLLTDQQIIDVLYTVGQYLTIATVINTLGVQTDGDLALDMPAVQPTKEKEVYA